MYDEYTDEELLEEAMSFASDFDWFDDTFLCSLDEALQKYGKLTPKQRAALERIHDMLESKFHQL